MAGVMSNNQAIGNPRTSRFDRMMGESLIGRSLQENRRGDVMYFWVHWTWGKENTAPGAGCQHPEEQPRDKTGT